VTGAWNGGSWLACGDLPAMGAVFYLGAGWPQWKPLDIPGTHLPLKRDSWLIKQYLRYAANQNFFKPSIHSNFCISTFKFSTIKIWESVPPEPKRFSYMFFKNHYNYSY